MDDKAMNDLGDALFRAFESDDMARLNELLADDFVAWSNASGAESDKAALLGSLKGLRSVLAQHRYENVRRIIGPDGFVEQHEVRGSRPDGQAVDLGDVCVVVRVTPNGRVRRLDEYLDTARLRQAFS